MRVLTGIQPSGRIHIGNYFGAIQPILDYQNRSELFLFLANYHSLTTSKSKEELEGFTIQAAIDLLSLGIDPEQTTFWVQSQVPQVMELTWILSQFITVNQLQLAHSYKDKVAKGFVPSSGLFFYPVLMAADILLFNSNRVPVGKDQKQHLEFARDIASRFHQQYGEVFLIPEPEILEETAVVPGTDGQKMSKSYGNTIACFGEEKEVRKAVMSILTDSIGVTEPKDPDSSIVFAIHSLFLKREERASLRDKYMAGNVGYGDLKKSLFECYWEKFRPYRTKRESLQKDIGLVREILEMGRQKASSVAQENLSKIKKSIGIL